MPHVKTYPLLSSVVVTVLAWFAIMALGWDLLTQVLPSVAWAYVSAYLLVCGISVVLGVFNYRILKRQQS